MYLFQHNGRKTKSWLLRLSQVNGMVFYYTHIIIHLSLQIR